MTRQGPAPCPCLALLHLLWQPRSHIRLLGTCGPVWLYRMYALNVHIMHLHSIGDMPLQGEENVCDDMNGDMHLLRLIKDWGYDSMLPQNR